MIPSLQRLLHSRSTYARDLSITEFTIYLTWESVCHNGVWSHSSEKRISACFSKDRWYDEHCKDLDNLKHHDLVVLLTQYRPTEKCEKWHVMRDEHERHLNIGTSTICSSWVAIPPVCGRDHRNQNHKHLAYISRNFTKTQTNHPFLHLLHLDPQWSLRS